MSEMPPQIDRRVWKELKRLRQPWEVVKKRDHYFVKIGDNPLICIGGNSSQIEDRHVMKSIERIKKI